MNDDMALRTNVIAGEDGFRNTAHPNLLRKVAIAGEGKACDMIHPN